MFKKILKYIINILNVMLIVLSIGLLIIAIFRKDLFENFFEFMKLFIVNLGNFNYVIAFCSSLLEAFPVLGVVLPGQNILLVVGGFFGKISNYNLAFVIIVASFGAIVGNYIGFILGKFYGDSFFDKYGVWFGIGKTEVSYLKIGIEKWGAIGITLGKFHPMTRAFLPFIAGSMGMKSQKFMIYNAIGSIIRATTIILLGVVFVHFYKILLDNSGKISLAIFLSVAAFIYFFKKEAFLKYWKEKNEELDKL